MENNIVKLNQINLAAPTIRADWRNFMTENIKNETMKHLTQILSIRLTDEKTRELHRLFEEIYETILSKSLSYKESNAVLDCVRIAISNTPFRSNDGQELINALRRYVCKY